MKHIGDQIPQDLLLELQDYIQLRVNKIKEMKDQGIDATSEFLQSEQDYLGRLLKPSIQEEEQFEKEDRKDQLMAAKGMQAVIGKQINENDPLGDDQYVNVEGLRRVYKPKDQRDIYKQELEKKIETQDNVLGKNRKMSTIECQTDL